MISAEKMAMFGRFFYPRSVAVIGVSANEWAFGSLYLSTLIRFGYKGKLYPVNPRGGEFFGLSAYPSVKDIPNSADLAVISVPAPAIPSVLEDCLAKGIKAAVVVSAGFSESGEEGRSLEEEVVNIARKGIRVIGPNCFGTYCPSGGLSLLPGSVFARESGAVGLMAQSGQFPEMVALQSRGLGIRFSKVVSYGDACDLNEADFLEYLAEDAATKVIQVYIEGVREGRRFLDIVRRTSRTKPVILWKAGLTQLGKTAVSSHTGSLGGEEITWKAFFSQSGAVRVNSLEELIDATIAFLHLPPNCGPRVALVSGGGSGAVAGADACEYWGLSMPPLSGETRQKLSSLLPQIGTSARNPVDMGIPFPPTQRLTSVLEVIAASEQIDAIIVRRIFLSQKGLSLVFGRNPPEEDQRELMDVPLVVKEKFGKPIIVVLCEEITDIEMLEFEADRRELRDYYLAHGIPVYPTLDRAIRALAHFVKYQEQRNRLETDLKLSSL